MAAGLCLDKEQFSCPLGKLFPIWRGGGGAVRGDGGSLSAPAPVSGAVSGTESPSGSCSFRTEQTPGAASPPTGLARGHTCSPVSRGQAQGTALGRRQYLPRRERWLPGIFRAFPQTGEVGGRGALSQLLEPWPCGLWPHGCLCSDAPEHPLGASPAAALEGACEQRARPCPGEAGTALGGGARAGSGLCWGR